MENIDRNTVIYGRHHLSRQAADAFFLKSGGWRRKVYDYIHSKGINGATDQEIQAYFDKSGDTIRPTRKSLQQDGLISDSGRTRKNSAGNECTVYITYEYEGMLL